MLEQDLDTVADDFEGFVVNFMESSRLILYQRDIARLLEIMYITLHRPANEKWYEDRYDRLGLHCCYMIVKLTMDKRLEIKNGIPKWLYALAGYYDQEPIRGTRLQPLALLKIGPRVETLVWRGYTKCRGKPLATTQSREPSHEP